MTQCEFHSLPVGTTVWFEPNYFKFPMVGVIKEIDGVKGVWINFFGQAQCLFELQYPRDYECVTMYEEK